MAAKSRRYANGCWTGYSGKTWVLSFFRDKIIEIYPYEIPEIVRLFIDNLISLSSVCLCLSIINFFKLKTGKGIIIVNIVFSIITLNIFSLIASIIKISYCLNNGLISKNEDINTKALEDNNNLIYDTNTNEYKINSNYIGENPQNNQLVISDRNKTLLILGIVVNSLMLLLLSTMFHSISNNAYSLFFAFILLTIPIVMEIITIIFSILLMTTKKRWLTIPTFILGIPTVFSAIAAIKIRHNT